MDVNKAWEEYSDKMIWPENSGEEDDDFDAFQYKNAKKEMFIVGYNVAQERIKELEDKVEELSHELREARD